MGGLHSVSGDSYTDLANSSLLCLRNDKLANKCASTLAARRPDGVSGSPALLPPCLKFNKAAFLVCPTWFLIGGLSYRLVRLVKF